MKIEPFVVESDVELRALQRVFREAKFCIEADDDEITASPIVAVMFDRVMDALIAKETAINGQAAADRWENWLRMDNPLRAEWGAVRRRILNSTSRWNRMTVIEKHNLVKIMFRPFRVPDDKIVQFISEVDNSSRSGNS